jgi:hypothetical protein
VLGRSSGRRPLSAATSWRGQTPRLGNNCLVQPQKSLEIRGFDDPLLSDRSWAITSYRPNVDALAAAPTRIVIAVGEESEGTFTGRTTVATAELLGQQATMFPSHHGGFLGGEFGYAGQPEAFADTLHDVLDNNT